MTTLRADLVTVFHNEQNHEQHLQLKHSIRAHEPIGGFRLIAVDNRSTNRGFAKGCNHGAFQQGADAPIIGFLNPDTTVSGPFIDKVRATLTDRCVITGCRFGKPKQELDIWGVDDWVCGAALFVRRNWFTAIGGFDEQFVWGWEETDLIRQAQAAGLRCRSIPLPITHASPSQDTDADSRYKHFHFSRGRQRFYAKWGTQRQTGT